MGIIVLGYSHIVYWRFVNIQYESYIC